MNDHVISSSPKASSHSLNLLTAFYLSAFQETLQLFQTNNIGKSFQVSFTFTK